MDDSDLLIQAGFSTAKMEAETRKVVLKYEAAAKQIAKKYDSALAKVGTNETLKATAREVDRLAKKYDPAYAGAKKYERGIKELNRAVEVGAIGNAEYEQGVKRLVMNLENGGRGSRQFAANINRSSGSAAAYGSVMQNVGWQVGDFATQVGAGTSATQALGQQLPQLLGGFGAFGAVAGAAVAVMVPLGAAIYGTLTGAVDLEEQMKALTDVTDLYVAAAAAAATPVEELREKYGDLAEEIAGGNKQVAEFARAAAEVQLGQAVQGLATTYGGLSRTDLVGLDTTQGFWASLLDRDPVGLVPEIDNTMLTMADSLGIAREEAIALTLVLERLGTAKGIEAQVTALEALLVTFQDVAGSPQAANDLFATQIEQAKALLESLSKQREASLSDEERQRARIMTQYLADERRLADLISDRGAAEREVADARAQADADRVSRAQTVLEVINREIEAIRDTKGRVEEMQEGVEELQEVLGYLTIDESGDLRASLESMENQLKGARTLGEELDDVTLKSLEGQFDGVIGAAERLLQRLGLIKGDLGELRLPDAGHFEAKYVARSAAGEGGGEEELVRAVLKVSEDLGIAAKDLLTAMSYETGGTFNPWQAGPTTQWGQHRGLIQWGEPQRARYGVSESSTITEQVEAAGRYLTDAGVKAGDGLLRIYAAINAGSADKIHASDANNGGAPGTVLDKVNDQMAGHRARATGLLNAYAGVSEEFRAAMETERRAEQDRERETARIVKLRQRELGVRQDMVAAAQKQLSDAQFEAALVGKTASEQARLRAEYMLTQDAKRRGIDLNEQLIGQEGTYADLIREQAAAIGQVVASKEEQIKANDNLAQQEGALQRLGDSIENSLVDSIVAAESFEDAMAGVVQMLARAAIQAALFGTGPFGGGGGGLLGGVFGSIFGSANGNVFSGGAPITPFANGGVVGRSTYFPMSDGRTGQMGEAGPEAIMPLRRLPNGRLGVESRGGGGAVSFAPSTTLIVQGDVSEANRKLILKEIEKNNQKSIARFVSDRRAVNARFD